MPSTATPDSNRVFFCPCEAAGFFENCFSLLQDPQRCSACVYNRRVLTKFTHEKDWTPDASSNCYTHKLEEIKHLGWGWLWRVHIREITRQPHCWDWTKRRYRFKFMRLGHTHNQVKIECNRWRVSLRMQHLPKRFHLVRGRPEHPIFWRFQDLKMSKLIKTFCNNALTPWAFFLISKHVLRRVRGHDLGRIRSRGAGILWTAPRWGLRAGSAYQWYRIFRARLSRIRTVDKLDFFTTVCNETPL